MCGHSLSVIDRSTFTVMGRLAGLLPSQTPPHRSRATTATAQQSLSFRVRVRQSSSSSNIAFISRERNSSAPLFCSYNRADRAFACHPHTGTQMRALVRQIGHTARWSLPLPPALARQAAQIARRGFPQARFHPRTRFRFWPRARSRRFQRLARKTVV